MERERDEKESELDKKMAELMKAVGTLARGQEMMAKASRYTGLLSAQRQIEWHDPLLQAFAGRLLAMSTISEELSDDPVASCKHIKVLIDVFSSECQAINEKLRDGRINWNDQERDLGLIVKRALPDHSDIILQLSHVTATEKKKREREPEERCSWHPKSKDGHTDAECKAQRQLQAAQIQAASTGLYSGLSTTSPFAIPPGFVSGPPVQQAAPMATPSAQHVGFAQATPMPVPAAFAQPAATLFSIPNCPTCGRRHSPKAVCWDPGRLAVGAAVAAAPPATPGV
jgi:hypothetical protein